MSENEIKAIENSIPRTVVREELGGDFYYRCPWIVCNTTVHSTWKYCPMCGQKLDFEEVE